MTHICVVNVICQNRTVEVKEERESDKTAILLLNSFVVVSCDKIRLSGVPKRADHASRNLTLCTKNTNKRFNLFIKFAQRKSLVRENCPLSMQGPANLEMSRWWQWSFEDVIHPHHVSHYSTIYKSLLVKSARPEAPSS